MPTSNIHPENVQRVSHGVRFLKNPLDDAILHPEMYCRPEESYLSVSFRSLWM